MLYLVSAVVLYRYSVLYRLCIDCSDTDTARQGSGGVSSVTVLYPLQQSLQSRPAGTAVAERCTSPRLGMDRSHRASLHVSTAQERHTRLQESHQGQGGTNRAPRPSTGYGVPASPRYSNVYSFWPDTARYTSRSLSRCICIATADTAGYSTL